MFSSYVSSVIFEDGSKQQKKYSWFLFHVAMSHPRSSNESIDRLKIKKPLAKIDTQICFKCSQEQSQRCQHDLLWQTVVHKPFLRRIWASMGFFTFLATRLILSSASSQNYHLKVMLRVCVCVRHTCNFTL